MAARFLLSRNRSLLQAVPSQTILEEAAAAFICRLEDSQHRQGAGELVGWPTNCGLENDVGFARQRFGATNRPPRFFCAGLVCSARVIAGKTIIDFASGSAATCGR